MSLPPTARSTTLAFQVLVSGSVQDNLTGNAPRGALTVRLIDRDTGDDYPLMGRVLPDGTFAFYGSPETAFPRLAEQTYRLRVEASVPNYQPDAFEFDLGPVAGQPELVTRPVPINGIADMQVQLFTGGGLPYTVDDTLTLDRNPVRLRGRVLVSDDPTEGVENASLEVVDPADSLSTTADAEGYFEFPDPLSVALSVQIVVTAAGFEPTTLTYEPDYSRPVNSLLIGLKRS